MATAYTSIAFEKKMTFQQFAEACAHVPQDLTLHHSIYPATPDPEPLRRIGGISAQGTNSRPYFS